MIGYTPAASPSVLWSEPMESVWQMLPGGHSAVACFKRSDITVSDRLFIGAVVNLPRTLRWGAITWLADTYATSRETVYTIGRRAYEGLFFGFQARPSSRTPTVVTEPGGLSGPTVAVTDNRIKRSVLTLLLPGGVTLRPMQDCLDVALEVSRSEGFLSEFINEAGRQAGEVLEGIDYSPLGEIIVARDETYFNGLAFLVAVEPQSYVVLGGQVAERLGGGRRGVAGGGQRKGWGRLAGIGWWLRLSGKVHHSALEAAETEYENIQEASPAHPRKSCKSCKSCLKQLWPVVFVADAIQGPLIDRINGINRIGWDWVMDPTER